MPSTKVWTAQGRSSAARLPAAPQLATLVDEIPAGDDWLFEMKYDGYRALAAIAGDQVRLYTRNGNDWTDAVPRAGRTAVASSPRARRCSTARSSPSRTAAPISRRSRTRSRPARRSPISPSTCSSRTARTCAAAADRAQGAAAQAARQDARRTRRSSSPTHIVGNGEKFFEAMCEAGYEGIVAKLADAPYRGDRTQELAQDQMHPAPGIRHRRLAAVATRRSTFASLLLGTWEGGKLIYHGRVGTGFNDDERRRAAGRRWTSCARKTSPFANAPRDIARRASWIEPELVAEIAFTEFTPDGYLRHPSFLGLREDKTSAGGEAGDAGAPPPPSRAAPRPKPQAEARKARAEPSSSPTRWASRPPKRLGVKLTHPDKIVYPARTSPRRSSSPITTPSPSACCRTSPSGRCRWCALPDRAARSRSSRSTTPAASPTPSRRSRSPRTTARPTIYLYIDGPRRPRRRRADERARVPHLGQPHRQARKARPHHLRHRSRRGPRLRHDQAGRRRHPRHARATSASRPSRWSPAARASTSSRR